MSTFRATCEKHGEIVAHISAATVYIINNGRDGWFDFLCPESEYYKREYVTKNTASGNLDLLICAGVKVVQVNTEKLFDDVEAMPYMHYEKFEVAANLVINNLIKHTEVNIPTLSDLIDLRQ